VSPPRSIVFFFQAEDGIRADLVTGVQTCALPISVASSSGPGSVFDLVTMAAALETGAVTTQTSFVNTGSIDVAGHSQNDSITRRDRKSVVEGKRVESGGRRSPDTTSRASRAE